MAIGCSQLNWASRGHLVEVFFAFEGLERSWVLVCSWCGCNTGPLPFSCDSRAWEYDV